jgi:molybdopterin-containing oxidoreductase family iron-sulfur binding subunit
MIFESITYSFSWCRFLGDWQGGGYDAGYAKGRILKAGKMSSSLEANMTLSGAAADVVYQCLLQSKQALVHI